MTNFERGEHPLEGPEQKPTVEQMLAEAGQEIENLDSQENPYPGASAFRALIQAETINGTDADQIQELTARGIQLRGEFEKTNDPDARQALIERVKQELTDWLERLRAE